MGGPGEAPGRRGVRDRVCLLEAQGGDEQPPARETEGLGGPEQEEVASGLSSPFSHEQRLSFCHSQCKESSQTDTSQTQALLPRAFAGPRGREFRWFCSRPVPCSWLHTKHSVNRCGVSE